MGSRRRPGSPILGLRRVHMLRILVIAMALVACGGGGGGGGDDSQQKDAPPPAGDGPMIDAAIAAGPACGATTCTLGQQECCIGAVNVCKATGTCPSQGFACDGPEDCPGAVCCFPNSGGSRCQANNCQAIACHVSTDCPMATPKCCPKTFTPGYGVCQVQC